MDGLTAAQPVEVAVAFRQFRLNLASKPEPEVLLERVVRDGQIKTRAAITRLALGTDDHAVDPCFRK